MAGLGLMTWIDKAHALIDAHGFRSIEEAYEYLIDDRSHGNEYLAAAAKTFQLETLPQNHRIELPTWIGGVLWLENEMVSRQEEESDGPAV
jgi:hypothetical protein